MSSPPPPRQASTRRPFRRLVELELQRTAPLSAGGEASPPSLEGEDRRPDWLRHPPADLFGLALSGGGIRSATFCLGVLQALDRLGLLPAFHYLSTVSGGGYVGAFWSAWRHRAATGAVEASLFPRRGEDAAEAWPVRRLREFSNFLSPRLGVLSVDTGRLLVAALSAALPSLLATAALLTLVLLLWAGLLVVLFSARGGGVGLVLLLGATLVPLAGFEALWRRRERGEPGVEPPGVAFGRDLAYGVAALLAVALAAGAWRAVWVAWSVTPAVAGLGPGPFLQPGHHTRWPLLFAPALAWLLPAAGLLVFRATGSRFVTSPARMVARAAFDRVTGRLLFLAAAWLVLGGLWWLSLRVGAEVMGKGALGGGLTVTGALFLWARKRIGDALTRRQLEGGVLDRLKPYLPQVLAYAVIGLGVVLLAAVLRPALASGAAGGMNAVAAVAGLAAAIVAATLVFFDPNRMGLHSFYRGRISRAFLGASNPRTRRRRSTEEQEDDDLPLHELRNDGPGPLHLVCCAANDLSPLDPLENLQRGARSATLSPVALCVDDDWRPWAGSSPTLGSAVTASGAAFNSMMGSYSRRLGRGVGFLMAALNLRLGRWIRHPDRTDGPSREWAFPGVLWLKELLGASSTRGGDVHLSDGGHFENLGLYELLRRHCRYILACDCGADPEVAFTDVANVVRLVREDFGIEVEIDLSPLRPGDNGFAGQAMVAGDVHYPDGDTGVLLLLKPTLVGNEPGDILQYRSRNPAFPHESTLDQFYDGAQWESYRRLGEHAVQRAFGFVEQDADLAALRRGAPAAAGTDSDQAGRIDDAPLRRRLAAQAFTRARFDWLPRPPGLARRAAHLAERMASLDGLLVEARRRRMLHQVYRELPALDVAAGQPAAPSEPNALTSDDLVASLELVRRALLFMEEVFHSEELETRYNHPAYLGLVNYFARWCYAPLFRMWWPVLRSLYGSRFTRFMEARFGLESQGGGVDPAEPVVGEVSRLAPRGFALDCWRVDRPTEENESVDGWRMLEYRLRMRHAGRSFTVQAGLLRHLPLDGRGRPWEPGAPGETGAGATAARATAESAVAAEPGPAALLWEAGGFYVPPGLWGMGIGQDFLRRLTLGEGVPESVASLVVRVDRARGSERASRKAVTDLLQMYRTAGFEEAVPSGGGNLLALAAGGRVVVVPVGAPSGEAPAGAHWLVRSLVRAGAPAGA